MDHQYPAFFVNQPQWPGMNRPAFSTHLSSPCQSMNSNVNRVNAKPTKFGEALTIGQRIQIVQSVAALENAFFHHP